MEVWVTRCALLARFFTVTVALGTTAPDSSVTVPAICPVSTSGKAAVISPRLNMMMEMERTMNSGKTRTLRRALKMVRTTRTYETIECIDFLHQICRAEKYSHESASGIQPEAVAAATVGCASRTQSSEKTARWKCAHVSS
jgi:hypothetical protein